MTDTLDPTAQTFQRTQHDDHDEPGAMDPALARPTFEEIAAEAYAIYLSRQTPGRELDDWFEAERRSSTRTGGPPESHRYAG